MAYTTHKTVNRLARKKPVHLNYVVSERVSVERPKGGINLSRETITLLDSFSKNNNFSRQPHSFLEVTLQHHRRKTYDILLSVIRINILCLETALIKQPGPASQYRMQISNISTQILRDLKTYLAMEKTRPKQCINTWQITEVSNSLKRHADNSGNHRDL